MYCILYIRIPQRHAIFVISQQSSKGAWVETRASIISAQARC